MITRTVALFPLLLLRNFVGNIHICLAWVLELILCSPRSQQFKHFILSFLTFVNYSNISHLLIAGSLIVFTCSTCWMFNSLPPFQKWSLCMFSQPNLFTL